LCGLFSIDNALDHDVINKGYHEEPEKNFDNYVFASGPLKGRSLNLVNDSEALQRVLTLSGAKMPEGLHIAISKRIFEIESGSTIS
jgi:hypothetical protein